MKNLLFILVAALSGAALLFSQSTRPPGTVVASEFYTTPAICPGSEKPAGVDKKGNAIGCSASGVPGSASQNTVQAGPASGGAGAVTFRALQDVDIPSLPTTKIVGPGVFPPARLGTGVAGAGTWLDGLGVFRALVAGDIPDSLPGKAVGTAAALAADPADCPGGQWVTGVNAAGVPNCSTPPGGGGAVNDLSVSRTSATVESMATGKIKFPGAVYDLPPASATITAGTGSGAVEWYVTATGVVVVEHATAAGLTITCSGCTASQVTTPTVPAGAYHLATTTAATGAWSTTITDRRAMLTAPDSISGGIGIIVDPPVGGVRSIRVDTADIPRLGSTNVYTGAVDMSAAPATIVTRGAGLPAGAACDAAAEVGSLYAETANGGKLHRCLQTGAGTYSWVADSAGGGPNSAKLNTAEARMTSGASGVFSAGGYAAVLPNASGIVEYAMPVPTGASITTAAIKFRWIAEDDQTLAAGATYAVGCWSGATAAPTYGTGVALTLTPGSGAYRRLQAQITGSASAAAACPAGDILMLRLTRDTADANTFGIQILVPEVSW